MSEVKPGRYMVEVTGPAAPMNGIGGPFPAVMIRSPHFFSYRIPADCLRPLPGGMTAEERAVVEAAEKWADSPHGYSRPVNSAERAIVHAINALIASRTPPDPVAELVAAAKADKAAAVLMTSAEWRRINAADTVDFPKADAAYEAACEVADKAEERFAAALAAVEAARGGK